MFGCNVALCASHTYRVVVLQDLTQTPIANALVCQLSSQVMAMVDSNKVLYRLASSFSFMVIEYPFQDVPFGTTRRAMLSVRLL